VDRADYIFNTYLRFNKVAVGTKGFASGSLVVARECGHHDYFDILGFSGAAEDIEHIEAANLRHHDVTNDKVGTFFNSHCKRLFAIAG
jgi:hypothetical protein